MLLFSSLLLHKSIRSMNLDSIRNDFLAVTDVLEQRVLRNDMGTDFKPMRRRRMPNRSIWTPLLRSSEAGKLPLYALLSTTKQERVQWMLHDSLFERKVKRLQCMKEQSRKKGRNCPPNFVPFISNILSGQQESRNDLYSSSVTLFHFFSAPPLFFIVLSREKQRI